MLSIARLLPGISLLFVAQIASAQLVDGETVVFLGDSITEAGDRPNGYVALVRQALAATRPDAKITVVGAGISGNKVPDLEQRLDQDVLAHNPDLVVIYIGINDVWHSTRGQGTDIKRYRNGLQQLIRRCQGAKARVILATPSVIDEKPDGSNPLDSMLEDYAQVSRQVAQDTGIQLLDLRKAFIDHLQHYNMAAQENGILTSDGVHLNATGNRFVAARMLEALGERPVRNRTLRHHVYFRFEDSVSQSEIDEINRAFAALQNQIPTIVEFECGINNSPEGLSQDFTHAYTVSFRSEEDRDAYLPHPAHKKFVELVQGKLAGVFVVDYWAID